MQPDCRDIKPVYEQITDGIRKMIITHAIPEGEKLPSVREHLAVTNLCTCCNPNLLFSHRASHGKRGNLGAFLKLV